MRRSGWVVLALLNVIACDDAAGDGEPAAHGDRVHRRDAAAADAAEPATCRAPDAGVSQFVGVASASLAQAKLHFSSELALTGPGLDGLFDAKQTGFLSMSWQHDRLLVPAMGGFWDLEPAAGAHWVETSRMMHGVLTGDFDGDGDFDALLGSTGMETSQAGAPPIPMARMHVWERTAPGLVQRDEIQAAGLVPFVSMPFAVMDIDRDGHLDLVGFMKNELIGFFGDGAFGFRRELLDSADAELASWGALMLRVEDRNADDVPDLIVAMGRGSSDTTFRNLVFLRDASGAFMHHAPPGEFESSPGPLDLGDVTGDGLSDIVAQGFRAAQPALRLTASADGTTFAPTRSIEPGSVGLELGDVDADGTLDILTNIDEALVAQLARAGEFERRDLGLTISPNLLDFTVRPSEGRRPASLQVLYSVSCDPGCDEGCLDRCFETGCVVCTTNADCGGGYCEAGSCASQAPGTGRPATR